ncbi:MAG: hypothetical protein A2Y55_05915 [Actinobacteria bacterium RBG_16_68_12]|nr:MAG: hypothetical protein A2Y55_05915 [Actinobacteria bacterium RBG_16_68_12]
MPTKVLAMLVLAFVAGFAVASCGGDGDGGATGTTQTQTTTETETETTPPTTEEAKPTVLRVTVTGGVPESGIVRETVDKGDRVVLVVSSDVADEVHLHGYDISRDVPAGGTVRIQFTANVPGRFEVELEERGVQIADLTVEP